MAPRNVLLSGGSVWHMQVERIYNAIVLGSPKGSEGTVETNIGRDVRDRKKMGTFPYMSSR